MISSKIYDAQIYAVTSIVPQLILLRRQIDTHITNLRHYDNNPLIYYWKINRPEKYIVTHEIRKMLSRYIFFDASN